jgi:hypothetical protein
MVRVHDDISHAALIDHKLKRANIQPFCQCCMLVRCSKMSTGIVRLNFRVIPGRPGDRPKSQRNCLADGISDRLSEKAALEPWGSPPDVRSASARRC